MLVFEQELMRLTARAETAGTAGQVHAALTDAEAEKGARRDSGNDYGKGKQGAAELRKASRTGQTFTRSGVARIISSQMVYSDLERQAEFTGGVTVFDGDGSDAVAAGDSLFFSRRFREGQG